MCGETLKRGDKMQNHSEKSTVRMEARMEAQRLLRSYITSSQTRVSSAVAVKIS